MHSWSLVKKIGVIISVPLIIAFVTIILLTIINSNSGKITPSVENNQSATLQNQSNAATVRRLVESYFAIKNQYPTKLSDFSNGSIKLPKNIKILDTSKNKLTAENGRTKVWYQYSTENGAVTGGRVQYWDYVINTISDDMMYIGDALVESDFVDIN